MSRPTRKVVTVELEGLSLSSAIGTYYLFQKLSRQFGVHDLYEVELSLTMSTTSFFDPEGVDAEGLKKALNDLRVDATITEVER